MIAVTLPESPAAFADATWEDIAPFYEALAAAPLDEHTLDEWLRTWSRLEELVTEAASLAMIAYTVNTADPAREAAHLRFSTELMPRLEERSVELARRLVESGLSRPGMETTLARFRTQIGLFREANIPIFS